MNLLPSTLIMHRLDGKLWKTYSPGRFMVMALLGPVEDGEDGGCKSCKGGVENIAVEFV